MNLKLKCGTLTDERAESSYGIPVLVGPDGIARGPEDRMPEGDDDLGWLDAMYSAGHTVAVEIHRAAPDESQANHPLVRAFLAH